MSDLELREKVAKLMGAKLIARKWCYWDHEGSWYYDPNNHLYPVDCEDDDTSKRLPCDSEDGIYWRVIPFYEDDIKDAWLVVEEMRRRGYVTVIEHHPAQPSFEAATVVHVIPEASGDEPEVHASHANSATAICLAAVEALGTGSWPSTEGQG